MVSKATGVPLDKNIEQADETPYTLSYVIRKRLQVDGYMELPKEKRPPDKIIWDGKPSEIEEWFDRVYNRKKKKVADRIYIDDVE